MSVLDEWAGRHARGRAELDKEGPGDAVLGSVSDAWDVDDFDIRHLRYFLTVVRAGTVLAAAQ